MEKLLMNRIDPDLPDELQDEERRLGDVRVERLRALGVTIGTMRDEATKARKASGIESIWGACEDGYQCIDPLNRHEFKGEFHKPRSMEGPLIATGSNADKTKSTVYVRLVPRYVDMGAAKVAEILLPIDDKAFSFDATPVPDLVMAQEDETPVDLAGQPVMIPAEMQMPAAPGVQPAPTGPAAPAAAPTRPMTVADVADHKSEQASAAAKKAEQRIYDWMVEAGYPAQMRKVIHDAARIGVGVLKAPFPDVRIRYAGAKGGLRIEQKTAPSAKWIDPWNLFPHPGAGENIHEGNWIFERDFLSAKQMQHLKLQQDSAGEPIYIADNIDLVLKEGPEKCNASDTSTVKADAKKKDRYTVWYFTGVISREDMEAAGAVGIDALDKTTKEIYANVTLVNDTVIRATINPLDSGRFNYHVMPWSRRAGHWAGVGVGEQVAVPARICTNALRAWMNNAGNSSGVQVVYNPMLVQPADGQALLTPNKIWNVTEDGAGLDVNKAFALIEYPNIGPQLMAIVEYGKKLAEEASNIPLISQGQNGPQTPDTFGATELQNNNANTLLRSIAYSFDDNITEPVVHQFYEWLLLDEDVPEDEKGDFAINARGSIAMVEKAIQEQLWVRILAVAPNPAFGLSSEKVMEQILKSKRLDPRLVQLSEEEKAQRASQPPPEAPQVTVAKINTESREKVAQVNAEQATERMRLDTDRDAAYVNAENQRTASEHEARMTELQMKLQLAQLDYANKQQISLQEVKAQLAQTAMKLNVQQSLSNADSGSRPAPQVVTPPSEPAGLAPAGEAFEA